MPLRAVTGHQRLVTLLSRAIAHDRLPPALLLAGPSGVGKGLVAQSLAEAVNCLAPVADAERQIAHDGCGDCVACRRIARGVHPDVITLVPGETGTIKIELVRDVIERIGYRPFEGRRRVVIIDDADALVPAAQHALLKTLEEPPSSSMFVLVSARPDALLPTVLSRCPRLRFAPLAAADVAAVLVRDHGYASADAHAAAADAGGSVGQALAAAGVDLAGARETARRVLEQSARVADPGRRLDAVRDLMTIKGTPAAERDHLSTCLRVLASLLRDVGLLAVGGDTRALVHGDLEEQLAALARSYDAQRSSRAFGAVDEALTALKKNANPKVVANWLALQL